MHPFFYVFNLSIPAFAAMVFIAIAVSFGLVLVRIGKKGCKSDTIHLFILALCGAMFGAWFIYVVVNLPYAISTWQYLRISLSTMQALEVVITSLSGTVFYGGLIGGVVFMFIYAKKYEISLFAHTDLFVPILLIAHSIGRVGCFLAGCCYGIQVSYSHPFSVVYPEASLFAPGGVPLFATPLLEIIVNLIILCMVLLLQKFYITIHTGGVTVFYLTTYSIARFIIEFFRGDIARGSFLWLYTSQWVSILVFVAGVYMWAAYIGKSQGFK